MTPRTIAVDWSGRQTGERHAIWLAEADADGLISCEGGRTRAEVVRHLIDVAAEHPDVIVGLDLSFSLPAWFLEERGLVDAPALWDLAATRGERWLTECAPPFWGRAGTRRPDLPAALRLTEERTAAIGGVRPKSTFQVSGAGSVGAGSVRGWPFLAQLRAAGFAVWPFDAPRTPMLVEVWPRAFTGPMVKRDASARATWINVHAAGLVRDLRDRIISSEDAFDAAATALGMAAAVDGLLDPPVPDDPDVARLEGWIWAPGTPA